MHPSIQQIFTRHQPGVPHCSRRWVYTDEWQVFCRHGAYICVCIQARQWSNQQIYVISLVICATDKNRQEKGDGECRGQSSNGFIKKGVKVSSSIGLEDVKGLDGGPHGWVGPGGCTGEAVSDGGQEGPLSGQQPQSSGFLCSVSGAGSESGQEALCAWPSRWWGEAVRAWPLLHFLTPVTRGCHDIRVQWMKRKNLKVKSSLSICIFNGDIKFSQRKVYLQGVPESLQQF